MQGSEFRKRERRRLIEWFASKDIEKIEDAEFRRAIRPIKALQQEKEEKQHVPKYDANSLPDRRGGGENVDFPDGESLPPGLSIRALPGVF